MDYKDILTSAFSVLHDVTEEKKRLDQEQQQKLEDEKAARIAEDHAQRDLVLKDISTLAFKGSADSLAANNVDGHVVNPVARAYFKIFPAVLTEEKVHKLVSYADKIVLHQPNESVFISAKKKFETDFGLENTKALDSIRALYLGSVLPAVTRVLQDNSLDSSGIVENVPAMLKELNSLPDRLREGAVDDNDIRELRNKLIKTTLFSITLIEQALKLLLEGLSDRKALSQKDVFEHFQMGISWMTDALRKEVFNGLLLQVPLLREHLSVEDAKHLHAHLRDLQLAVENKTMANYYAYSIQE